PPRPDLRDRSSCLRSAPEESGAVSVYHRKRSMTPAPLAFSSKATRTPESPITQFMELALNNQHLISLAAGLVDGGSLPAGPVAAAVAELLADPATARAALQYGTTQGHAPLIEEIVRHVAGLDGRSPAEFGVNPRDVLVTTGSQQIL